VVIAAIAYHFKVNARLDSCFRWSWPPGDEDLPNYPMDHVTAAAVWWNLKSSPRCSWRPLQLSLALVPNDNQSPQPDVPDHPRNMRCPNVAVKDASLSSLFPAPYPSWCMLPNNWRRRRGSVHWAHWYTYRYLEGQGFSIQGWPVRQGCAARPGSAARQSQGCVKCPAAWPYI